MTTWRRLEIKFPNLNSGEYQFKSDATSNYNCISWAIGDTENWWWPIDIAPYRWPATVPMEETIESFKAFFSLYGYEECETGDLELDFEKIAIYVDNDGVPSHAAKQLSSGIWTSKIGDWEDIEHSVLEGLEGMGFAYGTVKVFLKKPRS